MPKKQNINSQQEQNQQQSQHKSQNFFQDPRLTRNNFSGFFDSQSSPSRVAQSHNEPSELSVQSIESQRQELQQGQRAPQSNFSEIDCQSESQEYIPPQEVRRRQHFSNKIKGKDLKNFLVNIKTCIKKYLEHVVHLNLKNIQLFNKKSSNLREFTELFNREDIQQYLREMFEHHFLNRQILIGDIGKEKIPIFLFKLRVLEKGFKRGKISHLC